MTNYQSIQFIGTAISTTPGNLTSIEGMSDDGKYLGYVDVETDIQKRLELLKQLISKATTHAKSESKVLKIFVIPEFFFRGDKGAYFGNSDSIFNKHFGGFLKQTIYQDAFNDWMFVFGTLLTSTDMIDRKNPQTAELFPIGDNLLDV